jgi:hypothetical protein
MRRLAEEASTTTTTISSMVFGDRETQPEIVGRVVDALSAAIPTMPKDELQALVNELVGRAAARGPFQAHPDADFLEPAERRLINELIFALTRGRRRQQDVVDSLSLMERAMKTAVTEAVSSGRPVEGVDLDSLPEVVRFKQLALSDDTEFSDEAIAANEMDAGQQEPGAPEDEG